MPAPASPSTTTIESPPETDVATTYINLTGVRAESGLSEWLVNDGTDAAAVVRSSQDIFLEAVGTMQMISKTHMHNVSTKNTQYYGLINRQVEQNEIVVIGGDFINHINTNQSVAVVGDHLINIAKKQVIQTGGAQKVEVAGGTHRTLDVLSGGVEITIGGGGKFEKTITGNCTSIVAAKVQHLHNSNYTNQSDGDFFATKAAMEISTTAAAKETVTASAEAAANLSGNAKLNHANSFELNIGLKHEITVAGIRNIVTKATAVELAPDESRTVASRARKIELMMEKWSMLLDKADDIKTDAGSSFHE